MSARSESVATPADFARAALERRDPRQTVMPGVIPEADYLARVRTVAPVASQEAPGRRRKLEAWQRAGLSPTQRSVAYMKAQGYALVETVERWIPQRRIRKDFAGIGDLIAVGPDVVVIQTTGTTGGGNFAARVRKVSEHESVPILLKARMRVAIHGWTKLKAGWTLKELEL